MESHTPDTRPRKSLDLTAIGFFGNKPGNRRSTLTNQDINLVKRRGTLTKQESGLSSQRVSLTKSSTLEIMQENDPISECMSQRKRLGVLPDKKLSESAA